MTKLYGSVEAGGTKFVCAVGDEKISKLLKKVQFSKQQPPYENHLTKTVAFF